MVWKQWRGINDEEILEKIKWICNRGSIEENDISNDLPTYSETFVASEIIIKWYEAQQESTHAELLTSKEIGKFSSVLEEQEWSK